MKILSKFTRQALKENRTRTIVTIIGIMLSMALITAVIEGAYSGLQFLANSEIASYGKWEGEFKDLDQEQFLKVSGEREIKESTYVRTVGWAEIDSQNEYKPYLRIWSAADDFGDFVKIHLTEGRLPENENEILLPMHLFENGGVNYKVGDTLNLKIGERTLDGEDIDPWTPFLEGELLSRTTEKNYTVVGFYERFQREIEDYSCPGYTALTKGAAFGPYTVFFTLKNVSNFYKYVNNQTISDRGEAHSDLLYFNVVSSNNGLMQMLLGLIIVLVILIAFGSITLIYNSFSISVSERTRQFGILKSIGATGKQIRGSVFYEALLLGGAGIVLGCVLGCAGIGITLFALRDKFSGLIGSAFGDTRDAVQMKLVITPIGLVIAAVICLIVVLISAWIPANRAMRVAPIDAIRQSMDIKVNPKKIKTSKLTQKLFGIEGTLAAKNFKRNKKRARSVVVSIFLSVLLFITASSFVSYLKDSVDGITASRSDYELQVQISGDESTDYAALLKEITENRYVEDGAFGEYTGVNLFLDKSQLKASTDEFIFENTVLGLETHGYITLIDDNTFREVCKANGVDPEPYFNKEDPMALVYNFQNVYYEENGSYKYRDIEMLDMSKAPLTIKNYEVQNIDGYIYMYTEIDDQGVVHFYYMNENDDYDNWKPVEFKNEAVIVRNVKVGAAIEDPGYFINRQNFNIIYPESMKDLVIGKKSLNSLEIGTVTYMLKAHDHVNAKTEIEAMLKDGKTFGYYIYDIAEEKQSVRSIILIIDVFSYGFIILISLIAVANVFNTISTNINLRRREIAMLKSIGLSNQGFTKMMNLESIIYGLRGLAWGLPISIIVTFIIWRINTGVYDSGFYIPWHSLVIAIGSVFVVVFAAMWYTATKVKKDNVVETLKNENL